MLVKDGKINHELQKSYCSESAVEEMKKEGDDIASVAMSIDKGMGKNTSQHLQSQQDEILNMSILRRGSEPKIMGAKSDKIAPNITDGSLNVQGNISP